MSTTEERKNWSSFRTVIETIICAGVLWILRSITSQNDDIIAVKLKMEELQRDNTTIKEALAKIPSLDNRTALLEMQVQDIRRRMDTKDYDSKQLSKGWQR